MALVLAPPLALASGLVLPGCGPRHDEQISFETYEAEFPAMPSGTRARAGGDPPLAEDEDPALLVNPIPDTSANRARGGTLFAIYCTPCHGPAGAGDGPVAGRLGVKVRDLRSEHTAALTDGEIFTTIGEGTGSMLGLGGLVPRDERWLLVHAVRHLRPGHETPAAPGPGTKASAALP
jgi:mono/diheme cytochrome c family protein